MLCSIRHLLVPLILLYISAVLCSRVLCYSTLRAKLLTYVLFLKLIYPADTFQNAVILFDYVIPHYFGQTAILAEQNKKKTIFPSGMQKSFLFEYFWHNLDFIISPRFSWQGGGQNYPHAQLNFCDLYCRISVQRNIRTQIFISDFTFLNFLHLNPMCHQIQSFLVSQPLSIVNLTELVWNL